jgi:hypothetical protein
VTVAVVEDLEVVQVEQRHRHRRAVAAGVFQGPGQLVVPGPTVRQAGQLVGAGQLPDLPALLLHLAHQLRHPGDDEQEQRRAADHDRRAVGHRAAEQLEGQDGRGDQRGGGQHDQLQPAQPRRLRGGGAAQLPRAGVQRGDAEEHKRGEEDLVEAAAEPQHLLQRLADRAEVPQNHPGGVPEEEGGQRAGDPPERRAAAPGGAQQPGHHGQQQQITDRVRDLHRPPQQRHLGVQGDRVDHVHPGEQAEAGGDGGGVDQRRPVAPRVPAPDQQTQPQRARRVEDQEERVGRRRHVGQAEHLLAVDAHPDAGGVAGDAEREAPPGQPVPPGQPPDAENDGGGARVADRDLPAALPPGVLGDQLVAGDRHGQGGGVELRGAAGRHPFSTPGGGDRAGAVRVRSGCP